MQSRLHHVLEPRAKETHVQLATSRAAWEQLEMPHITFHISLSGTKSMNIEVICGVYIIIRFRICPNDIVGELTYGSRDGEQSTEVA